MSGGLRKRRTNYFVQIPRVTIRDKQLSFRARGLLGFILDQSDTWDVRSDQLSNEGTEGRDAIRKALHELGERGYYRIERRRMLNNRFTMGTAVSEERVPEWAEEYAEASGKPILCIEQPDGSFMVKRKDGTLTSDGFPAPERPDGDDSGDDFDGDPDGGDDNGPDDDGPDDGEPPLNSPKTAFQAPGNPAPGAPASGVPASGPRGAFRETMKGDHEGRSSVDSLRSSTGALDDDRALIPDPRPATEPARQKPKATKAKRDATEVQLTADAEEVASWWWEIVAKHFGPCTLGGRPYMRLRSSVVKPALKAGLTKRQVAQALQKCEKHVPLPQEWQRACAEVGGYAVPSNGQPKRQRIHRQETTGLAAQPPADVDTSKMTDEELEAHYAGIFGAPAEAQA